LLGAVGKESLRKWVIILKRAYSIFYRMHASYKKWIEGFVFSFALVLALIFENNGLVKIMCMFSDQVFGLRRVVFLLLFAFFYRTAPY
jgi:hypothetical protein